MSITQHIYKLTGKVQHYSWGGYTFIPRMLGIGNIEEKPFAEYWLGAHPNHSGTIPYNGQNIALNEFINNNGDVVLGQKAMNQFGSLPFLLKVLDVKQMLSIQVHPNKTSAEEGYTFENKNGIPVTASHRNYKDDNHKPELMVALSDFWLLHGFKPADKLKETLSAIPEFEFLISKFDEGGYKALYETVMLMEQDKVNALLEPIVNRIMPLYHNGELLKSEESFWAARAVETFCKDKNFDKGIFSIFFFNLLHLKEGEGIYQEAQLPHAYLEGQNVEIMANSDNVLRAGLTDKHIDVAELVKHVKFKETVPNILGTSDVEKEEVLFSTPAAEFELYQYRVNSAPIAFHSKSAEIVLVLSGRIVVSYKEETLKLSKGEAAFIIADTGYTIHATEEAEVYRATVPQN